jgi:hypothetical protein
VSSASPALAGAAVARKRKFGTYSFVLAVLAFALFTVTYGFAINVPGGASQDVRRAAVWMAIVGFLGVVPLMELAGIVLGIAALFRSGDRRILGLLGALLNALLLAGGVVLGKIVVAHMP